MTAKLKAATAAIVSLFAAGCSGAPNLTTGSLFGGDSKPEAPAAPVVKNDPTSRAFQVGTTSARAVKCGFNFNPDKLKAQYIASEAATVTPADMVKVEQTYDVAFRAVAKAVSGQREEYCGALKTAEIKLALNRHLNGDFSPAAPRAAAAEEEGGFFSAAPSSSASSSRIPTPYDQD